MRCKKCNKKNVSQAFYCIKCGNVFTKSEREIAKNKSLITKYKNIKEWYDKITLSKITGHIVFKILSILVVLAIGVFSIYKNGSKLKVIDGDYKYSYNNKLDEYYLYLNKDESVLNLYMPHETNNYYVSYYNGKNELIEKNSYESISDLKIKVDDVSNYYIISLDENDKESIKLYALRGEE